MLKSEHTWKIEHCATNLESSDRNIGTYHYLGRDCWYCKFHGIWNISKLYFEALFLCYKCDLRFFWVFFFIEFQNFILYLLGSHNMKNGVHHRWSKKMYFGHGHINVWGKLEVKAVQYRQTDHGGVKKRMTVQRWEVQDVKALRSPP